MATPPEDRHEYEHGHEHADPQEQGHEQGQKRTRPQGACASNHGHMDARAPSQGDHEHARSRRERDEHEHGPGGHAHGLRGMPEFKLWLALGLTVTFMLVEFGFSFYARSIALSGDAGHMLGDAGSLVLALIAQRFAARPRTPAHTYGYRRAEILAAFVNGVALLVTALLVVVAAWDRWQSPVAVRGQVVTVIGVLGLGVNLASAAVLAGGSGHNLNTRAALAHVLTDALGSVMAIVAGVVSWRFGWSRIDPLLSFAMAGLILYGAWLIIRRASVILMEGTPPGLDLGELELTIRATPGVADLHDLHAWTISEGFDVVTVHVVLDGSRHGTDVARDVGERIRAAHRVAHVTVQPEAPRSPELRSRESLLTRPKKG